jgi:hypothetical protein
MLLWPVNVLSITTSHLQTFEHIALQLRFGIGAPPLQLHQHAANLMHGLKQGKTKQENGFSLLV